MQADGALDFDQVRVVGPPDADGEYVSLGGGAELVHLHDYNRLYAVPGLYEHVVQGLLECRSPQVAVAGLAAALERLRLDPANATLLEVGAGSGFTGELARELGFGRVVGLDLLPAARAAALRDRPGVYDDYLVGDLAQPPHELSAALRSLRPAAMIAAGALGGAHMPPAALRNTLALLEPGAPIAFTIHERWTRTDEPGGFRAALAELERSGAMRVLERTRFLHRLSTSGQPIHYELFVAATGAARR